MNIGLILAGGVGNRLGAAIPKQFIKVLGKPVLAYTIDAFEQHPEIDVILVVCVKPYINYLWKIKKMYGFSKLLWITEGGDTFQESVLNGIRFLKDKITRDDLVIIHFGASPFITADIISDTIRVCNEKGNAISTTDFYLLSGKKKNTSSVSDPDNYSNEYINRDTIAVMNSPHAFQYGFIEDLYREAIDTGVINTVEPHTTTLMYAMNKPIYFAKGSQNNIKITRKEDLELFEGYILEKQRNKKEMTSGDVIVFLANGFEECEGLLVVDLLRRAGLKVVTASVMGRRDVVSSRDIVIRSDCLAENVLYSNAKMIVLPGGRRGTEILAQNEIVKEQCITFAQNKYLAAICAAPTVLDNLSLLDNKRISIHPDFEGRIHSAIVTGNAVTVDGNIITGKGLGATIPFALELVKALMDNDTAEKIAKAICYDR